METEAGAEPPAEGDLKQRRTPRDVRETDPQKSLEEAGTTVRRILAGLLDMLPKFAVALLLLLAAWALSVLVRLLLHKLLSGWERSEAVSALVRVGLFFFAIGAGLSVVSGDAAALVGSLGLIGLALSWALQTPIESFSGWVLNALRGYYRPGDRIEVGEVFGDVIRIDVLTTTVWELGGPGKAVAGAQPTGAVITFPNWEILRSNIINYSRDFPYVWDEITVSVANESDLGYTRDVLTNVAESVLGGMMRAPADQYRRLLERQHLAQDVDDSPKVFLTATETATNCSVRYLVPVHERRRWSTELLLALSRAMSLPDHRKHILPGYPRTKVDLMKEKEA